MSISTIHVFHFYNREESEISFWPERAKRSTEICSFFHLLDDIRVLNSLQKCNFSDGGRGHTVIVSVNSDFLHGDYLFCLFVDRLEYDSIGAFAELFSELVARQLFFVLAEAIRRASSWPCSRRLLRIVISLIYHL